MKYEENVSLAPLTSLKLGGVARYFYELSDPAELPALATLADSLGVKLFILGGGSNTIFADGVVDKLIVKNTLDGVRVQPDPLTSTVVAGAGVGWDDLVAQTLEAGYSGLEALSGIPGTVGAAPVQNIGAYGVELADVFASVLVWDREEGRKKVYEKKDCDFEYRSSVFKTEPDRFVILRVTLELVQGAAQVPEYPSLKQYLAENDMADPTPQEVRAAVLAIRSMRLPSVEEKPNAGSFFTNPIVSRNKADELEKRFPDIVRYDVGGERVKIPAGWLIERAGLKGKCFGNFKVSPDNALVLIHHGDGTTTELLRVQKNIQTAVEEQFGILLEREPNLIT